MGKGSGTAIGAAKIRFDMKKNIYEIETFGHGTFALFSLAGHAYFG
jgi:hypothetical protein